MASLSSKYRTVSRSLTRAALLAGASLLAFPAGNTALAQTPAACTNHYQPGITIPASYGAEYDIVLGSGEMELTASCAKMTPTLGISRGNTIGGTTGVVTSTGGTTVASGETTGTTGGTTGRSTATCTPGNHGLIRGRPLVANGTLVADDGCPLHGVHTHTIPETYFSQWYGKLSWWQNLHDIGHFNLVSAAGYLGEWNNSTDSGQLQTVEGEEAVLDQIVSLATQSGMYVNIVFFDFNSSDYWRSANIFWNAIAPRYAYNTNVTYEIVNEPDLHGKHVWRQQILMGHEKDPSETLL